MLLFGIHAWCLILNANVHAALITWVCFRVAILSPYSPPLLFSLPHYRSSLISWDVLAARRINFYGRKKASCDLFIVLIICQSVKVNKIPR